MKTDLISYGATAAIVNSTALIAGLSMTNASKPVLIGALLIAAIADNLTDSLSLHIFQESKRATQNKALIGTIFNFVSRLCISLSFVLFVLFLPFPILNSVAIAWGLFLLCSLTYKVSKDRGAKPAQEIAKHLMVAIAVVSMSVVTGNLINHFFL